MNATEADIYRGSLAWAAVRKFMTRMPEFMMPTAGLAGSRWLGALRRRSESESESESESPPGPT